MYLYTTHQDLLEATRDEIGFPPFDQIEDSSAQLDSVLWLMVTLLVMSRVQHERVLDIVVLCMVGIRFPHSLFSLFLQI